MALDKAKTVDLLRLLERIGESLKRIEGKLDELVALQKVSYKGSTAVGEELPQALDVMTLLSLPDHLRKTAMVVCRLGSATADEVSKETGRARAVESGYLNQLRVMGHLKKERRGREVHFYVE